MEYDARGRLVAPANKKEAAFAAFFYCGDEGRTSDLKVAARKKSTTRFHAWVSFCTPKITSLAGDFRSIIPTHFHA